MNLNLDEARYGKTCLLLLKVCPFTLRRVIDDHNAQHGYTSLQDFLDKNKHDLYHIMNRRCCCRLIQSRITPMNRSQWDLFFIKNSSLCRTGYTGDCPCQYDAKPGVTSDVMDITLCCLVIKNICSRHAGINMLHIETIRTIRNHLIHAKSPQLDLLTYNGYLNQVKTALLDLAKRVSSIVHTETLDMIQELETRVMDAYELGEIRKIIVDQKRIEEAEERISDMEKDLDDTNKTIAQDKKEMTGKVTKLEGNIKEVTEKVTHVEGNMNEAIEKVDLVDSLVKETSQKVTQVEGNMNETIEKVDQVDGLMKETTQKVTQVEGNMNETIEKVDQVDGIVKETTQKVTQVESTMRQMAQRVAEVESSTKQTTEKLEEVEGSMTQAVEELTILGGSYQELEATLKIRRGIKRSSSHLEDVIGITEIDAMKKILIKTNNVMTKVVQLSPLRERGKDELPIEMLFASVVIHEDYNYTQTSSDSGGESGSSTRKNRELTNPVEIFIKDSELVKKIYMLGDAAHGKTTFCLWLLKNWLNVQQKHGNESEELNEWEKIMAHFDFVFHLQFRNVEPHLASVTDMICENVFGSDIECGAAIRHVLSSNKYRSLIIMDGLDEWNPNEEARRKLACQGIPNIRVSSTVSCFFSMRPWVFADISKIVTLNDRVIEILGLKETGMIKVVENVLVNHYRLKPKSSKYNDTHDTIIQNLQTKCLNSFMKIPLLAVVCIQIWYEGKQVGDSMTSFYAALLNMLIERVHQKHEIQSEHDEMVDYKLPDILSYHFIENCISVLLKLGKVAYEGLISNETHLLFQKGKLEKEIGLRDLQFLLNVGLISQKEAPSLLTKNVSLHFFHKSIQEFLAVIYIVMNKEVGDSFCNQLTNVKVIMELSNVIMFICGMSPSLGSVISQRVVSVTDSDEEICQYRKLNLSNEVVEKLYQLQLSWYRDLEQAQHSTQFTFYVSDVCLRGYMNEQTVRMTRKILSDHNIEIRSLWISLIPTIREFMGNTSKEHFNFDEVLNDYLSNRYNNTGSLVMISINAIKTSRCMPTLCIPSLRFLFLRGINYIGPKLEPNVCPSLLKDMNSLRVIGLCGIMLRGWTLILSADMNHLESVELEKVYMTESDWQQFLLSMESLQHTFKVSISRIIDEEFKRKVLSSPNFIVNRNEKYILKFTRVWPLT